MGLRSEAQGPRLGGGPFRLQVWRRTDGDSFERVHAGDGPARSEALDAYLLVVDEGSKLRLADDPGGEQLWLTPEERERAGKERERAGKERERAGKERERAGKERERAGKEKALADLERERADKEKALADKETLLRAIAELKSQG